MLGCAYGVFSTAFIYASEADSFIWLAGMVLALPEWVVSGITLSYLRLLHPRVRSGAVHHPGPFALWTSPEAFVELLIGHLIFGLVCAAAYDAL